MAGDNRVTVRLGEAEAARLRELAAQGGSTPSAVLRAALRDTAEPLTTPATGRMLVLVRQLDALGVHDAPTQARRTLARIDDLGDAVKAWALGRQAARNALVERLAEGAPVAEVADGLAGIASWFGGELDLAHQQTRDVLHGRALRELKGEAFVIHARLAELIRGPIAEVIACGRQLVDVDAIARELASPPKPKPGRNDPPPEWNPRIKIGDLPVSLDPDKAAGQAAAKARGVALARQIGHIRDVAMHLPYFGGPGSALYGAMNDDQAHWVSKMDEAVQFAVADAIGWQPGLHAVRPPHPGELHFRDDRARQAREDFGTLIAQAPALGRDGRRWW